MVPVDSNVVSVVNGGTKSVQRRPHVLIIPFEWHAQYTVYLQFIYFLSSFDLTVTVCTSERRVKHLGELLSAGEFKSLDLHLVTLSDDVSQAADKPAGVVPPWEVARIMKLQFQVYLKKLAAETNPDSKPTCLVSDRFLNWAEEVAEELQIPRYLFVTSPAYTIYTTLKVNIEEPKPIGDHEIMNIPGQMRLPMNQFPVVIYPLVNLRNLAGILINTFEELDGEELVRAMQTDLQHMTTKPGSKVAQYLPVGPLVNIPSYSVSLKDSARQSNALQWLDNQPASSVLYVAFGNTAISPGPFIFELARGLELSGVPFLWVLTNPTTDVSTLLPPGFLDRVKTRGFVETGLASQVQILQHPSTGGFLCHAGSNSLLESISAGVPLLTWSTHGDQASNATLLVEGLKVGLRVRQQGASIVVPGEDVAAAVRSLMVEEKGKELRKNSERLEGLASGTTKEGGSSHANLHLFIKEIFAQLS